MATVPAAAKPLPFMGRYFDVSVLCRLLVGRPCVMGIQQNMLIFAHQNGWLSRVNQSDGQTVDRLQHIISGDIVALDSCSALPYIVGLRKHGSETRVIMTTDRTGLCCTDVTADAMTTTKKSIIVIRQGQNALHYKEWIIEVVNPTRYVTARSVVYFRRHQGSVMNRPAPEATKPHILAADEYADELWVIAKTAYVYSISEGRFQRQITEDTADIKLLTLTKNKVFVVYKKEPTCIVIRDRQTWQRLGQMDIKRAVLSVRVSDRGDMFCLDGSGDVILFQPNLAMLLLCGLLKASSVITRASGRPLFDHKFALRNLCAYAAANTEPRAQSDAQTRDQQLASKRRRSEELDMKKEIEKPGHIVRDQLGDETDEQDREEEMEMYEEMETQEKTEEYERMLHADAVEEERQMYLDMLAEDRDRF